MTALSNPFHNDPDLAPINQQPSQNPLPSLASSEPFYVPLMSTTVVPSSLLESSLIGTHDTRFAS